MKLPIFKAFFATISYLFAHGLTWIKILWLPALLLMGVSTYFSSSMLDAQFLMREAEASGDPSDIFAGMGPMFRAMGFMYLAAAIFYPMMIAGVLRHVLRGEAPRMPFYLSYGFDEIRVLFSFILLMIMAVLIYAVGALGLMVVVGISAMLSEVLGGILGVVSAITMMVVLIWFSLRMSLIFPATIDRRKIGIASCWSYTEGNAWRLFVFWILLSILSAFLIGAYFVLAMGGYADIMVEMFGAIATGDEAAIEAMNYRMLEVQRDMMNPSSPGYWLYMGATYFYTMFSVALTTVAGGVAWRYLSADERA